jgi:hypothetical protein
MDLVHHSTRHQGPAEAGELGTKSAASHGPPAYWSRATLLDREQGTNPAMVHVVEGLPANRHHGTGVSRDRAAWEQEAYRDTVTLQPWQIAISAAMDHVRQATPVPRFLDIPCPETSSRQAPWRCRGPGPSMDLEIRGPSISSVRGPSDIKVFVRTSGHQQLGTSLSSVTLLPDLDRSLDGLAPSPHRRPWPLIEMGPPTTWPPTPPPGQAGT